MSKNTPFFNNFIESQVDVLTEEEATQCSGGFATLPPGFEIEPFPPVVTMKAPSDDDEGCIYPPFENINIK